jgi:hypothetical protein
MTTLSLRRRTTAAADLRRQRLGVVGVGDANNQHWWLPHIPAKLLDCSSMTDRRQRGGFKAAAALGFAGGGAQGLGAARVSGEGPKGCGGGLRRGQGTP